MNDQKSKFILLLGSGISIPAGMPSTEAITQKVLSGNGVMRHTDCKYYFGPPLFAHMGQPDEHIPRVVSFISRLKTEIDDFYRHSSSYNNHVTNYEDLYYASNQIDDCLSGEYDNPVVKAFADKIYPDVEPLLDNRGIDKYWRLLNLVMEVNNYIKDVVRCMLVATTPKDTSYLKCIKEICNDDMFSSVDIFTLNHDTVLENFFVNNGIAFNDGFNKLTDNIKFWSQQSLDSTGIKVRFFKLHGSINWFWVEKFINNGMKERWIGLTLDNRSVPDIEPESGWFCDGRPLFLLGTFNKMLDYTSSIYASNQFHFYKSLDYTERLLVCGYSFNDKGINGRIIEWLESSPNNKMLIVHGEPEDLRLKARPFISRKWKDFESQKKLICINNWIEQVEWQEVKKVFMYD